MAKRKQSDTVDIKLRMKESLRARVERAAGRRGVSMNAEMVSRLEQSFDDEDRVLHFRPVIYGRQLAAVLEILGRVMRDAGRHVGFARTHTVEGAEGWMDDPGAFDQALKGALQILEALRPPGEPTLPEAWGIARPPGEEFANYVLVALRNPDPKGEIEHWASSLRPALGTVADRIPTYDSKPKGASDERSHPHPR